VRSGPEALLVIKLPVIKGVGKHIMQIARSPRPAIGSKKSLLIQVFYEIPECGFCPVELIENVAAYLF
jgi:hypothetical protein